MQCIVQWCLAIFGFAPQQTKHGGFEMDYVKAYMFMRDDKNWIGKLVIGALMVVLGFLVIPTFFLYGYGLAITRNVMRGEELPMPEWNDWGKLLTDGILLVIIQVIWAIPVLIVSGISLIPMIGASILDGGTGDFNGLIAGTSLLSCLVIFVVAIFSMFVIPPATILFARDGNFGSAFKISEIVTMIREYWIQIIVSWISLMIAGLVFATIFGLSVITICGPFILMFVGPVWFQFAQSHLYGQIGFLNEGGVYAGKFENGDYDM
jgi:hypothetical protein